MMFHSFLYVYRRVLHVKRYVNTLGSRNSDLEGGEDYEDDVSTGNDV